MTLNYRGDDTFKTVPGGLLSMFVILAVLSYGLLKFKYMYSREQWSLTQQTIMASEYDLTEAKNLNETALYGNISMGLQFFAKRPV